MTLKKIIFALFLTVGLAALTVGSTFAQESSTPIAGQQAEKIRFSFDDMPWMDAIRFFAEEANLDLQEVAEPPQGSFTYKTTRQLTIGEGLDLINARLFAQNFTLVRHDKMLVLLPSNQIPDVLIDLITPEQLFERGEFEVLKCEYDVTGLRLEELEVQIGPFVSPNYRDFFKVIPTANKMYVKDIGQNLRRVQELLNTLRQNARQVTRIYTLRHIDADSFVEIIRQFMNIPQGYNATDDETFKFAVQPLGDKIYLTGTSGRIEEFLRYAEMVDAPEEELDEFSVEKPYFNTYPVLTDAEVAFRVLQTMLEGKDVRMEQDPETGSIVLLGRVAEHKLVMDTISELNKSAPGFAVIDVQYASAADIVTQIDSLMGNSLLDDGPKKGPNMIADTIKNQISVSGTPQEVEKVKYMISQFDVADSFNSGPRTTVRFVPVDDFSKDDVMNFAKQVFGTTGRTNSLEVVMPEVRELEGNLRINRPRSQMLPPVNSDRDRNNRDDDLQPDQSQYLPQKYLPEDQEEIERLANAQFVSFGEDNEPKQDSSQEMQESSDEKGQQNRSTDYQAPPEVDSIPGAPIRMRSVQDGILIESDDLDALDDLENLLRRQSTTEGSVQTPKVFPIVHRKVDQVQAFLEDWLGISDGGGGGGGGIGGMMGNMVGNALGGAAGDILGNVLGGGGAGTGGAGAVELEGDVSFSIDVTHNLLFVAGATSRDLEYIVDVINILDQPVAPQEIDTVGQTNIVYVYNRPVVEVFDLVKVQLKDIVITQDSAGGGQQQNAQQQMQQQMARAIQQMTGGRGGRGGSSDPEAEFPKAVIGVDEYQSAIVVTGPEHVYLKVMEAVTKLDVESAPRDKAIINVKELGADAESIANLMKAIYPDLEIEAAGSAEGGGGATASQTPSRTPTAASSANDQRAAFMQAMQRAAAARAAGANRGGGNRGGGNRGGGGERGGGGGRGGRGGR